MKKRIILGAICACLCICVSVTGCNVNGGRREQGMEPVNLKCEYLTNPIGIDTQPRFSWNFASEKRGMGQSSYRILVSSSMKNLDKENGDKWDSGKIDSDESILVEYKGKELQSGETCFWKVIAWDSANVQWESEPAMFEMGLLKKDDWKGKWIAASQRIETDEPSPLMRKEFSLQSKVRKARAYVYGLGWYELHLNGAKVGDQVLTPANTDYSKTNLYNTYDVTTMLNEGKNAVGIWLGNGYGKGYSQWGWKWEQSKCALLQLNIEYEDGRKESIVTDETWTFGSSPIVQNHIYHGETYDAAKEQKGWDTAAFDDTSWKPVEMVEGPGAPLKASTMPPLKVVKTIKPIMMYQPDKYTYVFDLGQNFSGWARIKLQGEAGTTVALRYSELMDENNTIDPWTNREAKAIDTYILKGQGEEIFEPRFTYHGFRYVEVTGYTGKLELDSLEGRVVHADLEDIGTFTTSNPLLNQIQSNFRWGMLSNFASIPTDCPQRDERTPCLMDSMVVEEAAIQNFGMGAYYTKWMDDILGNPRNPDWGGDQVQLAWNLYQYYGDKRIVADNVDVYKRYVEYMDTKTRKHIYKDGFGDWCPPNNNTWESFFSNVALVNTALHYRNTELTARMAEIAGKNEEKTSLLHLADKIREAFHQNFWDEELGYYDNGRQTTDILPLVFGLVPESKKDTVVKHLVNNIMIDKAGHLDTGIFGTKYLLEALADTGNINTAYTILTQQTYPSFGDQIKQGATTTWEQWAFKGGMHSHNHAMFAGIGASFYTRLAGIQPLEPGYRTIGIRPYIPADLKSVDCSLQTVRGKVACRWQVTENGLEMEVTIPANTRGEIRIPTLGKGNVRITEGNESVWNGKYTSGVSGITAAKQEDGYITVTVGAGKYSFKMTGDK